jgi:hypothetical protein
MGSSFDGFLESEGLLHKATVAAQKRVIAWRVAQGMKEQSLSKSQMAGRMRTSRAALDRLLDPDNAGVTLATMGRAAAALGKRLRIDLVAAKKS